MRRDKMLWVRRVLIGGVLAAGGLVCSSKRAPTAEVVAQSPEAMEGARKGEGQGVSTASPAPSPASGAEHQVALEGNPAARSQRAKAGEPAAMGGGLDSLMGPGTAAGAAPSDPFRGGGPAASAAPAEAAIDPNGRFATTYRPGGDHLAAFESAVARGIIPQAERELVSDLGARYAPAIDAPKGTTRAVRTDLERAKVAPGGGAAHVRVTLRSTAQSPDVRPHLSVHRVLDVSGSMQGEPMARSRDAARSSDAQVRVLDGPVGPRRTAIKSIIDGITEGGGTNIGRGLELAYAHAGLPGVPLKVVLLLSDGRANTGITSTDSLSRLALEAFQKGVQTSSFGLGAGYDGVLMGAIADDGAGGYYYLRDPDQIAPALDKRLDPVATAVELRIRLKPDGKLLQVYGSRRLSEVEAVRDRAIEVAADTQAQQRDSIKKDREDDAAGGMRFFIPAFARDDSHALLLKLGLPPGVGSRGVAAIEIKYKDHIGKKNGVDESPLKVTYAEGDADSAASADPSVARTIQGFAAGETLAEAARQIAPGDRSRAATLFAEHEGILRTAAVSLKELLFLRDADRLARLREHTGSMAGVGDPLVLAMMLERDGVADASSLSWVFDH